MDESEARVGFHVFGSSTREKSKVEASENRPWPLGGQVMDESGDQSWEKSKVEASENRPWRLGGQVMEER